jgi:hypothetical protein
MSRCATVLLDRPKHGANGKIEAEKECRLASVLLLGLEQAAPGWSPGAHSRSSACTQFSSSSAFVSLRPPISIATVKLELGINITTGPGRNRPLTDAIASEDRTRVVG